MIKLRSIGKLAVMGILGYSSIPTWAQPTNAPALAPGQVMVLSIEPAGRVQFSRAGAQPPAWDPSYVGQLLRPGDRVKVQKDGRLLLRLSNQSTAWVGENTDLQIPAEVKERSSLMIFLGRIFLFDRDRAGEHTIRSLTASTAVRGTEFIVEVDAADRMTVSVLDGEVALSNAQGEIQLRSREQGRAEPGQKPLPTARIDAVNNLIQWCLYYPAVLDLDELQLSPQEQAALTNSLTAYRQGNLLAALASYPTQRQPASDSERVYLAALLLSVGNVEEAEKRLNQLNNLSALNGALADALRKLVAAVKGPSSESAIANRKSQIANSTALLAESYSEQAQAHLPEALRLARQAAAKSPNFSFARSRVAELEFGRGRTAAALEAVEKSLQLAPRNPEALTMKGFLLAAQNRVTEAIPYFEQAIAIDGSLGNAWLGRGLCKIRQGHAEAGRQDLQIAASVEPQRSLLRSYLSKAYDNAGDTRRANHEIELAKALDSRDPTAWLYSALMRREQNEINAAVRELEESIERNDNRAIYRSQLLLDQDRAVRSSSLATLYQSAGMGEASVREAAKAVSDDYGNYSAHLFLSDSFNALRDPTRFNLRYETPWFNELLLANLLSPVGGTPLSQNISQQEYSRLFEQNRIGLSSDTEYRSDGQVRELASQFGRIGPTAWALDLDYQHNDGVRPNNKLDRIEWYTTFKHQLTAQDSVMLLAKYQPEYHSGDNFQYFALTQAVVIPQVFCLVGPQSTNLVTLGVSSNLTSTFKPAFKFDEEQSPNLVGAYHREWAPGMHTLLLGGRLVNVQHLGDRQVPLLVQNTNACGLFVTSQNFDVQYRSEFEIYTAELNQIAQTERHALVLGSRFQIGDFQTQNLLNTANSPAFAPIDRDVKADFRRLSFYGYDTWNVVDHLSLTAGISYDDVTFPQNHRQIPITEGSSTRARINPKAALVWSPLPDVTMRGVYTRSLGGVSFDESYRLEPTQLAGFSQSFRTLLSESVAGSVSAPTYETFGAALDLKFKTRTYAGFQGEILRERVDRSIGIFDADVAPATVSSTPQTLRYSEKSAGVVINQLLADEWSLAAQYKFTRSELNSAFPALATAANTLTVSSQSADLHQFNVNALFNHPSGVFARAESQWYWQQNAGSARSLGDSSFDQVNLYLGYRFPRQRAEVTLGVLNVGGGDYHLNPLNAQPELPRERTYLARLRFRF